MLKGVCKKGHPLDEINTYTSPSGARSCIVCAKARKKMQWETGITAERRKSYNWKHGTIGSYFSGKCRCSECKKVGKTYHANQYKKHRGKRLSSKLKQSYGITLEQYQVLFDHQKGQCAVCGISKTYGNRALSVDHNHQTGKIRGLLCGACNSALGYINESETIALSLIEYIKLHKET